MEVRDCFKWDNIVCEANKSGMQRIFYTSRPYLFYGCKTQAMQIPFQLCNNEPALQYASCSNFNEEQWLHLLFLISDTQTWLDEVQAKLIYALPVKNRKKLLCRSHYLTAPALAHILERHYFKIPRYPNAGKFTIPVTGIVSYIRDVVSQAASPIVNSCNMQRVLDTKQIIGFDKYGKPVSTITVVCDTGGKIVTAFPGVIDNG
jgi:hypothetical protein